MLITKDSCRHDNPVLCVHRALIIMKPLLSCWNAVTNRGSKSLDKWRSWPKETSQSLSMSTAHGAIIVFHLPPPALMFDNSCYVCIGLGARDSKISMFHSAQVHRTPLNHTMGFPVEIITWRRGVWCRMLPLVMVCYRFSHGMHVQWDFTTTDTKRWSNTEAVAIIQLSDDDKLSFSSLRAWTPSRVLPINPNQALSGFF